MTSVRNIFLAETLIALSWTASVSAFSNTITTCRRPAAFLLHTGDQKQKQTTSYSLSALIFGWDGEEDEPEVTDIYNDGGINSCITVKNPAATAIAESISYNKDNKESLARLAVAFSPPERALTLKDIEQVQVICVSDNHIEIEAIICEEEGCVNLHVPVLFPQNCGSGSEMLEGCVLRNLDKLDLEAVDLIRVSTDTEKAVDSDDLDDLCIMKQKVEYPAWWVPRECDAALITECDTIIRLLNQVDFQNDVKALAQSGINALRDGDQYEVDKAIVADVGPAGILLRAKAVFHFDEHKPMHTLDVLVPFGGEPMQDPNSLRAAVLGAVASAHG